MKESESFFAAVGETSAYAQQYLQQQADLLRLEAAERISKTTSAMITALIIGFLVVLTLILLSIAAGFGLGKLWGSYALAFLVIAGFYGLITLLVYFLRQKWITNPVLHFVLRAFFADEEDAQ